MTLIQLKLLQQMIDCSGFPFKNLKKAAVRIGMQKHASQAGKFVCRTSFIQEFGHLRCPEFLSGNAGVDQMFQRWRFHCSAFHEAQLDGELSPPKSLSALHAIISVTLAHGRALPGESPGDRS